MIGTGEQTKGNLFYLNDTNITCLMNRNEDIWLWHKRLCHVNFDNMMKISRKIIVRGLPTMTKPYNIMCKNHQKGKMKKSSFKRKTHTSDDILELVHTNLCGPMRKKIYYGDKYFILFVDDYSRMMTVVFLKEKYEAFKFFKWYKVMVEKQSGKDLKCLRSDRGGEFILDEFTNFCNENGIKRQVSAPRTP